MRGSRRYDTRPSESTRSSRSRQLCATQTAPSGAIARAVASGVERGSGVTNETAPSGASRASASPSGSNVSMRSSSRCANSPIDASGSASTCRGRSGSRSWAIATRVIPPAPTRTTLTPTCSNASPHRAPSGSALKAPARFTSPSILAIVAADAPALAQAPRTTAATHGSTRRHLPLPPIAPPSFRLPAPPTGSAPEGCATTPARTRRSSPPPPRTAPHRRGRARRRARRTPRPCPSRRRRA